MKYFVIEFPNHTSFIVKTEKEFELGDVVSAVSKAAGLKGRTDTAYNPRQFLSINSLTSPSESQKKLARDLEKVLIYT